MGSCEPAGPLLPTPWVRTPIIESSALSRAANCRIFLKLENLQPSSSFKSRGIGNLILSAVKDSQAQNQGVGHARPLHFYSSSGGNAGLAAVTAARTLGYPCTVVVPATTEASIVAKLKSVGADDVVVHGDSWFYADQYLRETVMRKAREGGVEAVYVPPFDDERIWEGASTIVTETHEQLSGERPDAIVCSVGGGGLFAGVMKGLEKVGWDGTDGKEGVKVLATETEGAESLHESLRRGEVVTLNGINSVAKSLGAVRVCQKAFDYAQSENAKSVVLSDAEACMGCWRFADDERFLVEPACGVSVALCYQPKRLREIVGKELGPESRVVVVVCGGSRIDLKTMEEYRQKYEPELERKMVDGLGRRDVPSDFTS